MAFHNGKMTSFDLIADKPNAVEQIQQMEFVVCSWLGKLHYSSIPCEDPAK